MRLLRRARDHSPDKVAKMVEGALTEIGLDPAECRNSEGPEDSPHLAWSFPVPSGYEIFVILGVIDEEMVLQVRSLIAQMPQENLLPFYRRLLELNAEELRTVAFGISGQYVVLSAERPTADLDTSELLDMIWTVANYGELCAAQLKEEFGCPDWNDD
jgi:hypothetical protein